LSASRAAEFARAHSMSRPMSKSFLVLFFKKELLSILYRLRWRCLPIAALDSEAAITKLFQAGGLKVENQSWLR
jgi:hypothetical protein